MLILGGLGLLLIFADFHYNALGTIRSSLAAAATPFYWLTNLPSRLGEWGEENLGRDDESLQEENERLKQEAFILRGRMLKMSALVADNGRLRELLNSTALLKSDDVLIAETIGVSPRPDQHIIVIDKGSDDKVSLGQPVIDADGLMGQVVEVNPISARILLIADASHAVPVQNNRNGVRSVAEGTGRLDELELRHVAATTDIKAGDLLISSGLGGRFPVGYPVAKVSSVVHDPGQPFLTVKAEPTAHLSQSRHVLLVFGPGQRSKVEAAP
jgi:rod shape-determining protein MreC